MIYVVYRHLPVDGYNDHYKLGESNGGKIIKQQDFPGMGDFPPMYIRHYEFIDRELDWLLITYTNKLLKFEELNKVHKGAFKLLKENKYI